MYQTDIRNMQNKEKMELTAFKLTQDQNHLGKNLDNSTIKTINFSKGLFQTGGNYFNNFISNIRLVFFKSQFTFSVIKPKQKKHTS